jgi:hypothetical protein
MGPSWLSKESLSNLRRIVLVGITWIQEVLLMKSVTKKNIRLVGMLTTLLLPGSVSFADDSDVPTALAQWREHILTRGNLAGVELECEPYRSLVAMGPNALPDVFEAYRTESDEHVLYYYGILIRRIAHFDFFRYSTTPHRIGDREFQYDGDKPYLSLDMSSAAGQSPAGTTQMRDKLVQWWDGRSAFLNRPQAPTVVRTASGRLQVATEQLDKSARQEFSKLAVYGIYNIPDYIRIISEDNNAPVLSEWLRITNHPEFQTLKLTGDLAANGRTLAANYPARESKVELICNWWSQKSASYAALKDLHGEINRQVQAACSSRNSD